MAKSLNIQDDSETDKLEDSMISSESDKTESLINKSTAQDNTEDDDWTIPQILFLKTTSNCPKTYQIIFHEYYEDK